MPTVGSEQTSVCPIEMWVQFPSVKSVRRDHLAAGLVEPVGDQVRWAAASVRQVVPAGAGDELECFALNVLRKGFP
jgi:hypothetical protein